jgi:hypothetical protein
VLLPFQAQLPVSSSAVVTEATVVPPTDTDVTAALAVSGMAANKLNTIARVRRIDSRFFTFACIDFSSIFLFFV